MHNYIMCQNNQNLKTKQIQINGKTEMKMVTSLRHSGSTV